MTEEFLEQYKGLEQLLRSTFGAEMSVLNFESKLPLSDAEKLKVCRIIRNFLQHNPDARNFIIPSKEMIKHLKYVASYAMLEKETAKDRTYKIPPLKTNMTIRQASKQMNKLQREWMPIVDEKGILVGTITLSKIFEIICKNTNIDEDTIEKTMKNSELKNSLNDRKIVDCEEKLKSFINEKSEKIELIITRKGKYSGIVCFTK